MISLLIRLASCFNTQPPEGGWTHAAGNAAAIGGFNTQPPEGGWYGLGLPKLTANVSTHSRPKAAGFGDFFGIHHASVSTHSRPKAAGLTVGTNYIDDDGFNTQPPEGGWKVS